MLELDKRILLFLNNALKFYLMQFLALCRPIYDLYAIALYMRNKIML